MNEISRENKEILGGIIAHQWLAHISKSELNHIISILNEKNADSSLNEGIISSINNLLFSIKMEYGDDIRKERKEANDRLDDVYNAITIAEENLDKKITSIQYNIVEVYTTINTKDKTKLKEIMHYYYSLNRSRHNFRKLMRSIDSNPISDALVILLEKKIIKKSWFRLRVCEKKTEEELKNIVIDRYKSEKNSINFLKSSILTRQKDK